MEPGNTNQQPQNLEAEASLLGAILIDADALVKVADTIGPDDFYDPRHQRIYEAIVALYERRSPIDVLTLADQLKGVGFLDMVGGPSYLTELTNFVPTAAHAEQYADIVAQKALRRRLIKASQEMADLGYDESKQLRELIEEAEQRLFQVSQQHVKQSIVSLETILAESFDRLDDLHKDKGKIRGVPTGFKDLDNVLAGLQRSDLFVLAARPSMGKAQPLDANVLTTTGWKTMGTIAEGDELASIDGQPSAVTGVFPQGKKQIYKVTFSDGRSAECCGDHLWRVHYRTWPKPRVISTNEVASLLQDKQYQEQLCIDLFAGEPKDSRFSSTAQKQRPAFSSIKPTRQAEAQCIKVSHSSQLYITDDYVVTHNTALVLNLAHNVAIQAKEPVLFFSLEMSKEQLVDRLLSMESGVDAWALRTGNLTDQDFEKIGQAMGTLSEAKIYIDDSPGISVSDLRTKARREAHQHGLGLIIVDYLQLMSGGSKFGHSDNRVQEISEISRGLKGVARELNVPLIALSQLSRSVESRTPQIPQLADLRESGCLTGDTVVYSPQTGMYSTIRELTTSYEKVAVQAINTDTYKSEARPIERAFSTGIKPVYRLTTRTGRTIRATGNHKFLTITGWKRLDELSMGEHIATPRMLSAPRAHSSMKNEELALLGHLIGDGCTLPHHVMQYTTKDIDLAEQVAALATAIFGDSILPRVNQERGWYQVYLPSATRLTHGKRNPIASWLSSMNAFGLRSYEKRVPQQVFAQSNESIAIFIRHLWSTDGCVRLLTKGKEINPVIYYASSSLGLARDVQSLLIRFGICARLSKHPQIGKGKDQYHVTISGKGDLTRFIEYIGATGQAKLQQLKLIINYLDTKIANTNRDIIPKHIWRLHVTPALTQVGMTTRIFQAQLQMQYCGTTLYKANLSRERAATVASIIKSEPLTKLAQSDIYWDSIVTIAPDGEEEVFDLTIPDLHNFVANNIFVHNSIEQDADVVAFIYREDYYNPDTENKNIATILIKKHRNGPTDNVDLYFERDKQRFRSLDTKHKDPFVE